MATSAFDDAALACAGLDRTASLAEPRVFDARLEGS
jgi:hypothetical protein